MASFGYIQVTRACNQECKFCSSPPNQNTLTLKEAKRRIDDCIKRGYRGVILTGGEPTLSEHLPVLIEYCNKKHFYCRVITNGQKTADFKYLKLLYKMGLRNINVSIYSYKADIQSFLAGNKDSLNNVIKTLKNLNKISEINVVINTVINKYNANHLSENVNWTVANFPYIHHFVWNNLDPLMNRASINTDTIPKLNDFELELHRAMEFLESAGRTFRVERVPLCYMSGYEHYSTETREIVKKEERATYFLDEKGLIRQTFWVYDKAKCCAPCFLNDICAGLYQMDKYYFSKELYPVFVDKNRIIKRIIEG